MLKPILLSVLLASTAFAQPFPRPEAKPDAAKAWPTSMPSTRPISKEIAIGGNTLHYTARPDFITLLNDEGKPQARFFHTSYVLEGQDPNTRPITFIFNGGPGSSSIWLHMGAIGPRRVMIGDDGLPPPAPGKLVDNLDTWLPASDLVFIDPIGTGFSRAEPDVDASRYYSVEGDVASIGEFIRLYLAKHKRWGSPKFLAGESYGTTRAAGLSNYLSRQLGIDLSGIVLVSSVLEFSTISAAEGNDLPNVLFLPSYTAVAYVHKKLSPELQAKKLPDLLAEVEAFALGDYARALADGANTSAEKKKEIAAKLSAMTGLPEAMFFKNRLKVGPWRFEKALLADSQKIIGRYDGGVTGFDADPASADPAFDPSYTVYQGAYTSAFNNYVATELNYQTEQKYEVLAGLGWKMPEGRYLNVATQLTDAMTTNPNLRVMVASGYQDLATPYFATAYTIARMNLSPEARARLISQHYMGGHMMYHYPESRKKLGEDARAFIAGK